MKIHVIVFILTTSVFAWGPTGHRVVGEVAQNFLSHKTERKIKQLLDGEDLSQVANWPDFIKSEPDVYKHTFAWHYMTWTNAHQDYHPNTNGTLLESIEENLKTLKNTDEAKEKRVFALKFIVHLVGDLHQPLHVGNGADQGGNLCRVYFQEQLTNLHNVWDEKMVEFTRLSYTEQTKYLLNKLDKKNVKSFQEGTLVDWAKESKELRNQVYPKELVPSTAKPTDDGEVAKSYCNPDQNINDAILPRLSYRYSYDFLQIAEQRMLLAGLRLAKLLNDTF